MPRLEQISALRRLALHPPQLEGGVELQIEPLDDVRASLSLRHEGHALRLRAAWLSVPYPSGLRRLLAAEPEIQAVIVDHAPPGLAAAAEALGISYLDRHGRGRLVGSGFVYVASPRPDLGRVVPGRSSPFAPRASRVVRALLSDPPRAWRLSDVAAVVGLNPGNVHRALGALQEDGHVERDGDRYVLADPGSLLEAWADASAPARNWIALPVEGSLRAAVADMVERLDGEAVVSGELAAELLAPHLPASSAIVHCLDVIVWDRLGAFIKQLPTLPASGFPASERLVVDLSDEGVAQFGASIDGLDLVSPQQLYVDLARAPGRGREAAEEVRRQVLGY
jgi:hypothetical protein